MKTTSLAILLASSALLTLTACTDNGAEPDPVVVDQSVGQRVASSKARDTAPVVSGANLATLTEGNRAFATEMYHGLTRPGENLFFSPHSISLALAMTYAGARGDTKTEMAAALNFSLPDADTHAAFNALDLALKSRRNLPAETSGDGFALSIVNQTWGQIGTPFEDEFLDVLAVNYGAAMYLLDFASDPDGSRSAINDWVSAQTNDRIVDLLPGGSVTANTRLVLANAIYFKASWSAPFKASRTTQDAFTLQDGSAITAPTMHGNLETAYASGDGWALAEIPYVGEDLDMTVLVPDAGRFAEIEGALDQPFLDAAWAAATTHDVAFSLPRFTFKTEASLVEPLKVLGMNAAFNSAEADFTGMSTALDLYITGVYHQAFVAVDETGTEAAAATAVIAGTTSAPEPATLTVDRPFIVLIRDRPTGAILFLGRVLNPTG